MSQLHKRFTSDQVKELLGGRNLGVISQTVAQIDHRPSTAPPTGILGIM